MNNSKKSRFPIVVFCLILCLGLTSPPVYPQGVTAQPTDLTNPEISNVRIRYLTWPANDSLRTDVFFITKGTSQVLRFDRNIKRVSVSNPAICDITTLGSKEILVNAKEPGLIDLIVWDENQQTATYDVHSIIDVERLEKVLSHINDKYLFRVLPFNNTVAVYGLTDTAVNLKRINDAVTAFDKSAISFVKIKDPKQILLEVRFAEVSRTAAENFGFDIEAYINSENSKWYGIRSLVGGMGVNGDESVLRPSGTAEGLGPVELPAFVFPDSTSNATLAVTQFGQNETFSPILQWLENKNILKVIARPNLLAKDGEEGQFIVGGEFPIPIETEDTITVDYKPYGTKLTFTPEVLEDGVLRLKVDTEVSELDFSNTVTLGGNTVPSIIKRNQKTMAELRDGETLLIGGMLTQRINEVQRKVPILGDIPYLERLFKRKEFNRVDVELLVIITPHIVSPFQLKDKKQYFTPENLQRIESAVRIFSPSYPDPQGDEIRKVVAQDESYRNFSDWKKKREDAIDDAVKNETDKTSAPPQTVDIPAVVEIKPSENVIVEPTPPAA